MSSEINNLLELLKEVYRQCGNSAPAERRHALTPKIRDAIRDCLKQYNCFPLDKESNHD